LKPENAVNLKFEEGVAISKATGERVPAQRALCPHCGCSIWHIFAVGGNHHMHLECRNCHASFCEAGDVMKQNKNHNGKPGRKRPLPKGTLDYDGAGERLGIGRVALWRKVKAGKIRVLRPSGTVAPGSRVTVPRGRY
jgi:nitrite reductase/ring-hydroxylating ferredoxin subunit